MGQADLSGIGNQLASALPAHHVKLSVGGFLAGDHLSRQLNILDLGDDKEVSHSVCLLAEEVGRLPAGIETFEYFVAGLFGDGSGVSTKKGKPPAPLTPHVLQFFYDTLRQVHFLARFLDAFEFWAPIVAYVHFLLHLIVKHIL
jgi:hypothetical protein